MKSCFAIIVAIALIILSGAALSILGAHGEWAPLLFSTGAVLIGVPIGVKFFRRMIPGVSGYLRWAADGSRATIIAVVILFPVINITRAFILGDLTVSNFWVSGFLERVLSHGILMPIIEEVVFRFFILLGLMSAGVSALIALIFQSILFGVMHPHLGIAGSAIAAMFAFSAGLILLASRTIVVPIVVHIISNVSSLFMGRLHGAGVEPLAVTNPPSTGALAYAFVGTLVMFILAVHMYRSMNSPSALPVGVQP